MRAAAGLALVLALAPAAASAQPESPRFPEADSPEAAPRETGGRPPRRSYADPSAVIAAELALGRRAREKGQWRALREVAAPGAVVFAPRAVDAAGWLKSRREPGEPERWSTRTVWMSCDGDYAVSRGAWSRGADAGDYVVVWERQEKGDWKWLLREEGSADGREEPDEMIAGRVAECSGLPRRRRPPEGAAPVVPADATSFDRSLRWKVQTEADCARTVSVEAWNGAALVPVFAVRRKPSVAGCV